MHYTLRGTLLLVFLMSQFLRLYLNSPRPHVPVTPRLRQPTDRTGRDRPGWRWRQTADNRAPQREDDDGDRRTAAAHLPSVCGDGDAPRRPRIRRDRPTDDTIPLVRRRPSEATGDTRPFAGTRRVLDGPGVTVQVRAGTRLRRGGRRRRLQRPRQLWLLLMMLLV
jgi:hypothetical protein